LRDVSTRATATTAVKKSNSGFWLASCNNVY
jgi:hypothetical protein